MKKILIGLGIVAMLALGAAVGAVLTSSDPVAAQESSDGDEGGEDSGAEAPAEDEAERKSDRLDDVLGDLVADGVITEAQAAAVAEALRDAGFDRHHHSGKFGDGFLERMVSRAEVHLDVAAEVLGLSQDALLDALADGDTLADIAEDQGVAVEDLVDALVAGPFERIDDAVAEGDLTADAAEAKKQSVREKIENLVNGELRVFGLRDGMFDFGFRDLEPWGFDGRPFFERFEGGFDDFFEGLPEGLPEDLEQFFEGFEVPESIDELYEQFPELERLHERLEDRFGSGLPFFDESPAENTTGA